MRIRKSAARLLGSAYSASAAPAPGAAAAPELLLTTTTQPPHLAPCSAPLESRGWAGYSSHATACGEPCELSRSPWDLIAELSLSDPQVEDNLVDRYFVHVTTRASWLFSATMPATSAKKKKLAAAAVQLRREAMNKAKKAAEGEARKKTKVKKEEGKDGGALKVWKCKKNDGKRWHCHRTVSQPNTLCDYHFVQKRSYLNPDFEFPLPVEPEEPAPVPATTGSKHSSSNKPRRKKPTSDFNATEGFYYYAGFGPFRSKRQCRSNPHGPAGSVKQEEEEEEPAEDTTYHLNQQAQADADDANRAAPRDDDVVSCDDIAGIAGVDEDSSDDDFDGLGVSGSSMNNGNGEHQVGSGDSKKKTPWKRWRKPVKARSLKSLM